MVGLIGKIWASIKHLPGNTGRARRLNAPKKEAGRSAAIWGQTALHFLKASHDVLLFSTVERAVPFFLKVGRAVLSVPILPFSGRARCLSAPGKETDGLRRNHLAFSFLFLLFAAVLGIGAASPKTLSPNPPQSEPNSTSALQEGKRIIATVREAVPDKDFILEGRLRLRTPAGRWWKEIPIRFELRRTADGWQAHYLTYTQSRQISEELVIIHRRGRPNRYLYRPPNGKVVILQGDETAIAFAGSQFWLCDLGMEFLWWPDQRLIGEQRRKGRRCYVIESRNPHPTHGNYAKVKSWIDKEKLALLRAEAYGPNDQMLKEFQIGSVQKIHGRWYLKSMEIRNAITDARSRVEFELLIE